MKKSINDAREKLQLFVAARYYFNLAKDLKNNLSDDDMALTVEEYKTKFNTEINKSTTELPDWYLFSIHLGSSAVRLDTLDSIIESESYKRYYDMLKLKNNLNLEYLYKQIKNDIVHMLNRHKIAHKEDLLEKIPFKFLKNKWCELSFSEIYKGIEVALDRLEKELT